MEEDADEAEDQAKDESEKPATCMHSFFAIGQDQMKCTYCSVEKDMPACVR